MNLKFAKVNATLSLCIPTFNRKKTLINLLKKVKKFSKKFEDNIEVIVSDNSTDYNSHLKSSEIKKFNKNFKYNINKKNIGLNGNIEKLLRLASNDFIWILSDDDFIKPDSFKKILTYLDNKKPNLMMMNSDNIDFISKKKSKSDHFNQEKLFFYRDGSQFIKKYLYECSGIHTQIFKNKFKYEYFDTIKKVNYPTYQHVIFYYNIAIKYGNIGLLNDEILTIVVNAKKMNQEVGAYNLIEFLRVVSYLKRKDKKNIINLEKKIINLLWLTTLIFSSFKIFINENKYDFSSKFYKKLYKINLLSPRSKTIILFNHIAYLVAVRFKYFLRIGYDIFFSKRNWKKNIIKKYQDGKHGDAIDYRPSN